MSRYPFINPYNFMPFGDKKGTAKKRSELLSGYIQYSLLTKTPLFIPNTSTDQAFPSKVTDHKSYDFFSYTDRSEKNDGNPQMPVIPGSEIRGMLRSNYEMLTDSCMSVFSDDVTLSKRTNHCFLPGLLKKRCENGKEFYDLYEAEDCIWRITGENNITDENSWCCAFSNERKCYIQDAFSEGEKVKFKYVKRTKKDKYGNEISAGKALANEVAKEVELCETDSIDSQYDSIKIKEGYIIKGVDSPGGRNQKHNCHIFILKSLCKKDVDLSILETVLAEYEKHEKKNEDNNRQDNEQNNGNGSGKKEYSEYRGRLAAFKELKIGSSGDSTRDVYFPVYYSKVGDTFYLSPACITREVSQHKLSQLVKGFNPCDDRTKLCPACQLFGMLRTGSSTSSDKKSNPGIAVTSRIRFSDLKYTSGPEGEKMIDAGACYEEVVTLPPLLSPKINNIEFYVKRPAKDAGFWTYDYYVNGNGRIIKNTAEMNGRKFYWHQLNMKLPEKIEPTKLNVSIRPLKANVQFTGKVFFDKISEKELKQLIWLLNAGESGKLDEKKHGYKLGMAKPLGLGSVALSVEAIRTRKIQWKNTVVERTIGDYTWDDSMDETVFEKDLRAGFLTMTNFEPLGNESIEFHYPIGDDNGKPSTNGYDWFTQNHGGFDYENGRETTSAVYNRGKMLYREYMEALTPKLKQTIELDRRDGTDQLQSGGNDVESNCNVRSEEINCVWISRFPLKGKNFLIQQFQEMMGRRVWINVTDLCDNYFSYMSDEMLAQLSMSYQAIAFPKNPRGADKDIRRARKYFDSVIVSEKQGDQFVWNFKKKNGTVCEE